MLLARLQAQKQLGPKANSPAAVCPPTLSEASDTLSSTLAVVSGFELQLRQAHAELTSLKQMASQERENLTPQG